MKELNILKCYEKESMKYKPFGLYFFTKKSMIGLSLEGGGARGAYQAGSIKAFQERGIEFKGITGTSIGSINGAMIAQGDIDDLYAIWDNISLEKVFNVTKQEFDDLKTFDMDLENLATKLRKAGDFIKEGGIDISLALKILDESVNEEKIRARGVELGIVTFSLTEMKAVEIFIQDIPKGELKNYLLASSALPYFKLDRFHGIKYLDGGVYNALPTDLLVNKGYKEIWEIRLNSIGRKKTLNLKGKDVKINFIEPKEELSNILDFSNETAKKQLKMGYYDTLQKLDKLEGNLYYLERKDKEEYFLDLLKTIPSNIIEEFIWAFNLDIEPSLRSLLEDITPRLAELMDLGKNASYEKIITSFLEILAMDLGIERFKIYSFEEFINEIIIKSRDYDKIEEKNNKVIEFFLKNEFLSRVIKEQNIKHLGRIVLIEMRKLYEKNKGLGEDFIQRRVSNSSSERN